jgi:hypothetical protein
VPGFLSAVLLVLSALSAGLAVLVGLGFGLLTLGCLGALALFLYEGRLVLAATQAPAIVAMSVMVWLCWRWARKNLAVFDAVMKEGSPGAPEPLPRSAKLRLAGLDLAALFLCGLVAVQALVMFRRLLRSRPPGDIPAIGAVRTSVS